GKADGHLVLVGDQAPELVAGAFDEEGGSQPDGRRGEPALLVRPELFLARPHRSPAQRRARVRVEDATTHGTLDGGRGRDGRRGRCSSELSMEEGGGREHHPSRDDEGDEGSYHQNAEEDRPLLLLVVVRSVIHSHSQITRYAREAQVFFSLLHCRTCLHTPLSSVTRQLAVHSPSTECLSVRSRGVSPVARPPSSYTESPP